eukprot:1952570-Amphidinium_carterae.1
MKSVEAFDLIPVIPSLAESNSSVFSAFPSWYAMRECITAHPKQIPKTSSSDFSGAATFNLPSEESAPLPRGLRRREASQNLVRAPRLVAGQ